MKINEKIKLKFYGKKETFRVLGPLERIGENCFFIYKDWKCFNQYQYEKELERTTVEEIRSSALMPSVMIGDRVLSHSARIYLEKQR